MVSSNRIDYFSVKFKVLLRQYALILTALALALGIQSKSFGQFSILEQDPYLTCVGDTVTLHATQGSSYSDYNWYIEGLAFSLGQADSFRINNVNQYDNFYIVTADSSGTLVSDTINLFGFVRPPLELGDDRTICSGDTVRFFDQTGSSGIYSWNTGGTTFENSADTSGMYILSKFESIANPCESLDTVNLTVYPQPVVDIGPDTSICPGGARTLSITYLQNGTAPYLFKWSPNEGINDTTSPSPIVSPSSATTYIVNLTDSSPEACTTTDSITISVSPDIELTTTFVDSTICLGDSLNLEVTALGGTPFSTGPEYTYSWTPTSHILNTSSKRSTVFPNQATTYNVTVSDALGCTKGTTVDINVNEVTVALSIGDTTICPDSDITIDAIPNGDTSLFTFSWSKDANLLTASTPTIILNDPGIYAVLITNDLSCTAQAEVEISTIDIVLVDSIQVIVPDSAINTSNFDLELSAIGSNLQYQWITDGSGFIDDNSDSLTTYSPRTDEFGTTKFTVTVSNECSSQIAIGTTTIFGPPSGPKNIFIPNTVVPSSLDDNLNRLKIYSTGIEFTEFSMSIFNGNGEIIFETTDATLAQNEGWNTIPNHSDVYTYIIQFLEEGSSDRQELHGSITVFQ